MLLMMRFSYHYLLVVLLAGSLFYSAFGARRVDLGKAKPYAVLAGSTVTSSGTIGTVVTGNLGLSPGTSVTGFPPAILHGTLDVANAVVSAAKEDLTATYYTTATMTSNRTLSNLDLGGMTLLSGVYKFDAAAAMNGKLTLDADGDASAQWVFQVGSALLIGAGSRVIFKDGVGSPDNVFWQVGSSATLAVGINMVGNIMALASITVNNGAAVKGRCLAITAAVTMDNSVVDAVNYGAPRVDLGVAKPYAVLAAATITSTGTVGTVVTGNLGLFPGTSVTGFPPAVLHGDRDIASATASAARDALTAAYYIAARLEADRTLSNLDLGGMTLLPGVYKFDAAAAMNGKLTLDADGDASAQWVFQVGSALLIAGGNSVVFKNGIGCSDNVFWQVGSSATLAIGVSMVGNIMALASITVNDGASVQGRCLAITAAVTLDNSVINAASSDGGCAQSPPSLPAASCLRWFLGFSGESCSLTCAKVSRTCVLPALQAITTAAAFDAVVSTAFLLGSDVQAGSPTEFCSAGTNTWPFATAPAVLQYELYTNIAGPGVVGERYTLNTCYYPTAGVQGDCDTEYAMPPAQRFCPCDSTTC